MSEGKTRSIRDIAHLYISTPRAGGDSLRCLIAGVDRECMPGFHVANLSVALRSDSVTVRVVERSGLVLNVARFLALPARVYAALPGTRIAPSVLALDGIEVWFSEPPAPAGRTIDLIHAPALSDRAAFEQCADSAGADVTVLVARRRADARAVAREDTRLLLVETDRDDRAGGPDPRVVGTVTRWRRSLADALPAVARDRGSRLSRSYIECARHLTAAAAPAAGRGYREYGGSKHIRPRAG
jgi:hypothetical protein